MYTEADDAAKLEHARFRAMIVAMHPEKAKDILEILDKNTPDEDGIPEFAEELSDEEMEGYTPFSAEEVGQTIELMRKFGVAVEQ